MGRFKAWQGGGGLPQACLRGLWVGQGSVPARSPGHCPYRPFWAFTAGLGLVAALRIVLTRGSLLSGTSFAKCVFCLPLLFPGGPPQGFGLSVYCVCSAGTPVPGCDPPRGCPRSSFGKKSGMWGGVVLGCEGSSSGGWRSQVQVTGARLAFSSTVVCAACDERWFSVASSQAPLSLNGTLES